MRFDLRAPPAGSDVRLGKYRTRTFVQAFSTEPFLPRCLMDHRNQDACSRDCRWVTPGPCRACATLPAELKPSVGNVSTYLRAGWGRGSITFISLSMKWVVAAVIVAEQHGKAGLAPTREATFIVPVLSGRSKIIKSPSQSPNASRVSHDVRQEGVRGHGPIRQGKLLHHWADRCSVRFAVS